MLCYKKFLVFLVFLVLVVCSNKAIADMWDYTVHVEKQTEDFNDTRTNAIKDNREAALQSVIGRFISLSNFRVVDKLIDADVAYFFEDKLRLSNETVANDNYSVDITYYFNKDKILAFLNKSGIPYTTKLNNKVLFIPILENSISDSNIWYKLWTNNSNNDDYLTKIVLLGNLKKVNTAKILTQDSTYLQELKKIYKVDDVILAKINNANIANNSVADKKDNNTAYNLRIISITNNTYQDFDNVLLLNDALRYTIGFSEIEIKNQTISVLEHKNNMIFKVHYNSFVDWVAIYSYLKQIPQIEEVYLNEISDNYAIIKIKYHGSVDDIIKSASARNIIIDTAELTITCKGFCY